ncbi:MAG: SPFH/Band 7/PHB domain protein, partial [Xanthomonadales bacterium]|nr:SPFH/Band 7/PHB domain protein [Xanthomonadales bacterium]
MSTAAIIVTILVVLAFWVLSLGIRIVPQQHAFVIERLGRFLKVLEPGLNVIIPFFDRVAYRFDLRETPISVKEQVCITKDNTQISIDGVLYLQITDSKAAAYGTSNPIVAVEQLAQTIMRSDVGKKQLDEVLSSRSELNSSIVSELDRAATNWGVKVLRYEIRDISPPQEVIRAMELQITAVRQKRAVIAKSEGDKQQAINVSEGDRQQRINLADGDKQAQILRAEGEAQAILTVADATAKALLTVGTSLHAEGGMDAMRMQV